jgi:hypothetical protein
VAAAYPALKYRAKVITSLRDERRRSRGRIMPVRAGESETHRTAGGGAARLRPGIFSHLLRDERIAAYSVGNHRILEQQPQAALGI